MKARDSVVLVAVALVTTSCMTMQALLHPNEVRPERVAMMSDSIRATVVQFTESMGRLEASHVLNLIAGDSAFEAVLDGNVISGQAAFTDVVHNTFPTLRPVEPHVDSVRVAVLTPTSALARVMYRQVNAAGGGEDHAVITYALVHGKDGWRIVYQQSTTSR